ncbi:hypothetical protein FACS189441_5450 [Betaproteobacteria bacterium]|nr:hypothetical protein FACS189441_5450 [Betaproteobacteria bacterium]
MTIAVIFHDEQDEYGIPTGEFVVSHGFDTKTGHAIPLPQHTFNDMKSIYGKEFLFDADYGWTITLAKA